MAAITLPRSRAWGLDTWTFSAALGDYISVSIGETLPAGLDPVFTPWIWLQRPDGVQIGTDAGALAAAISVTAPLSGTYTVIAADYYGTRRAATSST